MRCVKGGDVKTRSFVLGVVGFAVLIAGLPPIADAQQRETRGRQVTGGLSGQVVSPQGSPLFGVKITLEGQELEEPLEEETDGAGEFQFQELEPGDYELTAELVGFITVRQEGIPVGAGRELVLKITMNPVERR